MSLPLPLLATLACATAAQPQGSGPFQRHWAYVSQTSAVVYWQLGDIRHEALSYLRWGSTKATTRKTPATTQPRWAHLHRITSLETGATYYYRMVVVDPETRAEVASDIRSFTTPRNPTAIRIPQQVKGPPFILDRAGATYLLTRDIVADGTAFVVTAPEVTLDLDGHRVVFGNDTDAQVSGVLAKNKGKATVCNGRIVQGARSKAYSTAVESRWRAEPTEVLAITTNVHLPCAYPVKFLGRAANVNVHHNSLSSRVTEIESRHYPGNDLVRLDVAGGNVEVHDNILTGGCHVGIRVSGEGPNVEVHHNDIRHHARYVNGYALACACPAMKVHHNRLTSTGRGAHLTREGIEFHNNHLDLHGHQTLDDMPPRSRPFKLIAVELHGIKLEGTRVRRCKVHDNYVRIVQRLPRRADATLRDVPATPLNLACYDPNAMNEVWGNTVVALTEYRKSRHGPYGKAGEWAAALYFVGMTRRGPARPGAYAAWVHDNRFVSNDIFAGANGPVNMTVRIENNAFTLATEPSPTETHAPFWRIGPALQRAIIAGKNRLEGMAP